MFHYDVRLHRIECLLLFSHVVSKHHGRAYHACLHLEWPPLPPPYSRPYSTAFCVLYTGQRPVAIPRSVKRHPGLYSTDGAGIHGCRPHRPQSAGPRLTIPHIATSDGSKVRATTTPGRAFEVDIIWRCVRLPHPFPSLRFVSIHPLHHGFHTHKWRQRRQRHVA